MTATNRSETIGALAGIKVIDLSRVLGGPFCAQVLGDHGADVIKVEPPQGDETREWGPFDEGRNVRVQCFQVRLMRIYHVTGSIEMHFDIAVEGALDG